jgi:hypothetical protein
VAASASRAAPAAATPQVATEALGGGASRLPPADAGWSVPSSRGFGTDEAPAAGTATAATGTRVQPTASTAAIPEAAAGVATEEASSQPASSALRRAREAAGIEEHEFRGILATLPDGSQGAVPASVRKPYKEHGVLSGQGSRIRSLKRAELGSDDGNRSQN